jgi:DNA-binding NarL/FixJ family response regulator
MSQTSLRIVIADDHDLLRMGLTIFIEYQESMVLVGEAQDGAEIVVVAAKTVPDVLLMDLNMPLLDGVSAIRQIKQANPSIQIIVLTVESDPARIQAALDAGATLYLSKNSSTTELAEAIQAVGMRDEQASR